MRSMTMAAALSAAILAAGTAAAAPTTAPTTAPSATTPTSVTTFSVTCRQGAEVSAADRAALETFGLTLFQRAGDKAYGDIYQSMAPELRGHIPLKTVEELFGKLHTSMAGLDPGARLANGRVTRVYRVDVEGAPTDRATACHGADGKVEAEVAISDAPRQAHVIIEGDGGGMRWGFSLWLREKEGRWEIWGFNFINITMGGRDAPAMWAEARAARDREDHMLAAVLYRGTRVLAWRGDYYSLPIYGEIEAEIRAYDPGLLDSRPLASLWTDGATAYGFPEAVVAQNADGSLRVVFSRTMSVWPSAAAVDAENRTMIRSFLKVFPEFAGPFKSVEVRSLHPNLQTVQATEWRIDSGRFK